MCLGALFKVQAFDKRKWLKVIVEPIARAFNRRELQCQPSIEGSSKGILHLSGMSEWTADTFLLGTRTRQYRL